MHVGVRASEIEERCSSEGTSIHDISRPAYCLQGTPQVLGRRVHSAASEEEPHARWNAGEFL